MSSVFFFRANEEKSNIIFRGIVSCGKDNFSIKLLKESEALEGEVTCEEIMERCQFLNLLPEHYKEECKTVFSGKSKNYSFSIDSERFTVKKCCQTETGSNFKIVFISTPLKKIDYSLVIHEILDNVFESNHKYEQEIQTSSEEKNKLLMDNQRMMKLVEGMEKEKLLFERIIYQKFTNLLNVRMGFTDNVRLPSDEREHENSKELLPACAAVQSTKEEVFDFETDSDETETQSVPDINQPTTTSNFSSNNNLVPSSLENVLNSLDFLDPSISFLNK